MVEDRFCQEESECNRGKQEFERPYPVIADPEYTGDEENDEEYDHPGD